MVDQVVKLKLVHTIKTMIGLSWFWCEQQLLYTFKFLENLTTLLKQLREQYIFCYCWDSNIPVKYNKSTEIELNLMSETEL